jgi:hypothetical protein
VVPPVRTYRSRCEPGVPRSRFDGVEVAERTVNRTKSLALVPVHMDDVLDETDVDARCEGLAFPLLRADAAAAFADVTIELDENGSDTATERNLGVVISELDRDSFANPEELYDEIVSSLNDSPRLRGA